MHFVGVDFFLLAVPFCSDRNSQGFIRDEKKLSKGRLYFPLVKADLKLITRPDYADFFVKPSLFGFSLY